MEKLLNLLNEYEEKRIKKINADWKLRVKLLFKPYTKEVLTNQAYRSCWLEVCSKYYWFIRWLVENDKIDRDKVNRESRKFFVGDLRPRTPRYKLLILLSISDTPIEDLFSYLK